LDWLERFCDDVVAGVRRRIDQISEMVAATRHDLERRQRATLDIGCCLVLSTLGLGLQVGGWSAWSVLIASGGYLLWVVAYSEATVQVARRQRSN
jgi:hypothetical protein